LRTVFGLGEIEANENETPLLKLLKYIYNLQFAKIKREQNKQPRQREINAYMCIYSNIKGMAAPSSTFPPLHFVLDPRKQLLTDFKMHN